MIELYGVRISSTLFRQSSMCMAVLRGFTVSTLTSNHRRDLVHLRYSEIVENTVSFGLLSFV